MYCCIAYIGSVCFNMILSFIILFVYLTDIAVQQYPFLFCRIPVYQAHKPHVLAHKWFYEFGTRHNMSIKAGRKLRDMRMVCRIAGARSAEQSEESEIQGRIRRIAGERNAEQSEESDNSEGGE